MKSITKILRIVLSVILLVSISACGKSQAIIDFEEAASALETKNQELDSAVSDLRALLDSEYKPLDMGLMEEVRELIRKADMVKVLPPEMGKGDEVINGQISEMNAAEYSGIINELKKLTEDMRISIQQCKQVTNPPEEQVLSRISAVGNITMAEAVTEKNDPNGMLNKPGGYTSAIFFLCDLVPSNLHSGNTSPLAKGTSGGGSIEVYATAEDAENRNAYISSFDERLFTSGKHTVIGTIVIRISGEMTEEEQELMIQRLIDVLTAPE